MNRDGLFSSNRQIILHRKTEAQQMTWRKQARVQRNPHISSNVLPRTVIRLLSPGCLLAGLSLASVAISQAEALRKPQTSHKTDPLHLPSRSVSDRTTSWLCPCHVSLTAEATPCHTLRSSTALQRWEACWYISAGFIKNNSRRYKECVINMHVWYLRGRAAFKVSFQQDNIFPCEVGSNSESYVREGKARGLCTVLIPFVSHFPPPSPPTHFINGFCNYW